MRTPILVVLFLLTMNIVPVIAQYNSHDPSRSIDAILEPMIKSRFGDTYSCKYQVIDSLIGGFGDRSNEEVIDPYGTLKGCILFSAEKQQDGIQIVDSSYFGIMKNGSIVWVSSPVIKGRWAFLFGTRDINNDGKVEILTTWDDDIDPMVEYMWIISWDGTTGSIINTTNQEGNSVIISSSEMYQLFNANNDSNYEIRGYWVTDENNKESWKFPEDSIVTRPYVTYRWNGSVYDIAPSAQQIPGSTFLPANRLIVNVSCSVALPQDSLKYNYIWGNSAASNQRMDIFVLEGISASFSSITMGGWMYMGRRRALNAYEWTSGFGSSELINSIKSGSTNGLTITSTNLPAICKFYIQGYRPFPDVYGNPNLTQLFKDDLLNNSFIGFTLGPTSLPNNFNAIKFLDTLNNYLIQSRSLGWIRNDSTKNKYLKYFKTARIKLMQKDSGGARTALLPIIQNVVADSVSMLTSEAYALIRYNTEYLINTLPLQTQTSNCVVRFVSSTGSLIANGTLQYRDTTWKDATNNNDGTFTINTIKKKLSLRMTYNNGTQTISNVTIKNDSTIIFQTKSVSINLQNSQGTPLDTGIVQYNSTSGPVGASWQNFGTTSNGVVTNELLSAKYTFRITYNGAAVSKAQNIDSNATVVIQTIPTSVQLQTSTGLPLDTGVVQYNANGPVGAGWQPFGITTNGIATKELLPTKYNFRITYDGATISESQSIDSSATVVFQTVKTLVQFDNSLGNPIDTGVVQFNSGGPVGAGWQNYGSTSNGIVSKELLPVKYTFRLTYCGSTVSIAQNVDSNATVVFSTVLCTVSVTNSSGSLLNNATVSYNAGTWKVIGTTVNGIVTKEFLPVKIQFRAAYGSKQQSVTQDVSANPFIAITLPVQ